MSPTCVFSYKVAWLAQQGKVTSLLLCLFVHWQLFVYGNIMHGLHGKRLPWNLGEGSGWVFDLNGGVLVNALLSSPSEYKHACFLCA